MEDPDQLKKAHSRCFPRLLHYVLDRVEMEGISDHTIGWCVILFAIPIAILCIYRFICTHMSQFYSLLSIWILWHPGRPVDSNSSSMTTTASWKKSFPNTFTNKANFAPSVVNSTCGDFDEFRERCTVWEAYGDTSSFKGGSMRWYPVWNGAITRKRRRRRNMLKHERQRRRMRLLTATAKRRRLRRIRTNYTVMIGR